MRGLGSELIFMTMCIVIVGLILKDGNSFAGSVKALSGGYADSVKALYGNGSH